MKHSMNVKVEGHVKIIDTKTNEVLRDEYNAIHPGNMAIAIARGLANSPNGDSYIYKLKLGNQGTYINSSQEIEFRPPNVLGMDADLYNPTYVEVVDEEDSAVGSGNSVVHIATPASTETRVVITAVISANEAINNPTDGGDGDAQLDPEGQFFFDELGLFTRETTGTLLEGADELMLSHLIFSPIEHTGNRELTIVYSLLISVS